MFSRCFRVPARLLDVLRTAGIGGGIFSIVLIPFSGCFPFPKCNGSAEGVLAVGALHAGSKVAGSDVYRVRQAGIGVTGLSCTSADPH